MIYTYRYTFLENSGRLRTDSEKIDADQWLTYLQANAARYGNLHDYVVASLKAIQEDDPLIAAAVVAEIDDTYRDGEPTAAFQFLMYCWTAFKAGEISATAWAAALASAWQSGQRSLPDGVALAENLLLRMFRSADREALFQVGASRKDWDGYQAALPERVEIYRGISSGSKFQENGLSWTTSPEEAKKFAARQVSTATQIPGVIRALVPGSAILAVFDFAQEVVVDPTIPKENVSTNFLNGSGLTKFRQNWKKLQAEETRKIREARRGG